MENSIHNKEMISYITVLPATNVGGGHVAVNDGALVIVN